jgi:hypothetical protein
MAKATKKVKFVGDAPKPKVTFNGTLGLRTPFQLTIPAKTEQVIDLGTVSDKFLSLLPHGNLFPNKEVVCVPGKPIKVSVMNYGDAPALLEIGDVVVEAYVLDASDFTVE